MTFAAITAKDVYLKEHIHKTFFPYQKIPSDYIVKSIIENKGEEIVLEFARQSGKTELVADTTLFLALYIPELAKKYYKLPRFYKLFNRLREGIKIGIFGPSEFAAKITFDRMRDRFKFIEGISIQTEEHNGNTLKLPNGSMIKCLSASETSNILGQTFDLIILEECQDIGDRKMKLEIFPMGASTNATRIMIGTPAFHKSYFYYSILKYSGKPNCFLVTADEVIKYSPTYEIYLNKEKERMGEDSDEFRSQYYLQWMLERGMFIIEPEFEKMISDYEVQEGEKALPCFIGIDWGKYHSGTTVTVVKKREEKFEVVNWLDLSGDNYADQLIYINEFLKNYRVSKISCDATGTQDQIVDQLRTMFRCPVEGVKMTAYGNDMIYRNLSDKINKNLLKFPKLNTKEGRKFKQQMLILEKQYKGTLMGCHHAEDKDAKDDYCDSLALALWAGSGRRSREMITNIGRVEMDVSENTAEIEW